MRRRAEFKGVEVGRHSQQERSCESTRPEEGRGFRWFHVKVTAWGVGRYCTFRVACSWSQAMSRLWGEASQGGDQMPAATPPFTTGGIVRGSSQR